MGIHENIDSGIVARKAPDFGLDGDIPKYWLGGDAFKSRFFDAMSMAPLDESG